MLAGFRQRLRCGARSTGSLVVNRDSRCRQWRWLISPRPTAADQVDTDRPRRRNNLDPSRAGPFDTALRMFWTAGTAAPPVSAPAITVCRAFFATRSSRTALAPSGTPRRSRPVTSYSHLEVPSSLIQLGWVLDQVVPTATHAPSSHLPDNAPTIRSFAPYWFHSSGFDDSNRTASPARPETPRPLLTFVTSTDLQSVDRRFRACPRTL